MNGKRNEHKKTVGVISILIVLLSILTTLIGMTPVGAAQQATVTRTLPSSVAPNGQFTVTLTQTGFLLDIGLVSEVLPPGFDYVTGSYTGNASDHVTYNPATRVLEVGFGFEKTISYKARAGSRTETAVFSGTYNALVSANNTWLKEEGYVTGD
ncbi:MAG TPA: hypothetical protein ENN68_00925, partial [Methanomicrobia archaeon]|nr:hypothetical protein [Methanomicrobia archaeon]